MAERRDRTVDDDMGWRLREKEGQGPGGEAAVDDGQIGRGATRSFSEFESPFVESQIIEGRDSRGCHEGYPWQIL